MRAWGFGLCTGEFAAALVGWACGWTPWQAVLPCLAVAVFGWAECT